MRVTAQRRHAERGQALILALALLGLLSGFSVAVLRLASASQPLASSVRQSAYQDAEREAGGQTARQLIADGLGCSPSPMTATFAANGETTTERVAKAPPECASLGADTDGGDGALPGDYVVCSTVSAGGVDYPATVTVRALLPNGGGTSVNIDIVHFTFGTNPPC
jgi:hypothetical protein